MVDPGDLVALNVLITVASTLLRDLAVCRAVSFSIRFYVAQYNFYDVNLGASQRSFFLCPFVTFFVYHVSTCQLISINSSSISLFNFLSPFGDRFLFISFSDISCDVVMTTKLVKTQFVAQILYLGSFFNALVIHYINKKPILGLLSGLSLVNVR